MRRPRLAVFKFASCDGCQLSILGCEDELLPLAARVDIAYFAEASSAMKAGPYDVSLVDGSISTPRDVERIHEVRRMTRTLVAIGACATAGGIQALRNARDFAEVRSLVYPRPEYVDALADSTSIGEHVVVDVELRGCPIDRGQLLAVLGALLAGRVPRMPTGSVCLECKRAGNPCILVTRGVPCLGPITHLGCGALCPSHDRGCYGCFGPAEAPNTVSSTRVYLAKGARPEQVDRLYHNFNTHAPELRSARGRDG